MDSVSSVAADFAARVRADAVSVLVLILAAVVLCAAAFVAGVAVQHLRQRAALQKRLAAERNDAVKRSRAVIGGQVAEQLAPFLPGFPCNPGDVRFVGKPVDYVAFPGATDGAPIREILLIEVKTGGAKLSAREKEIEAAVKAGRVRYLVWRTGARGDTRP